MLTVTMSGMNNSGIDIVCYKLSSIVCCQLDLFVRRSAQLDYQKRNIIVPLLKSLIKHHYEIIQLAQTLNELLSPIALIQCVSSGLAICFVGFQLMIAVQPGSPEFISQVAYFGSMFSQIFFYCWYGQSIILKSISISPSHYSTNWYDAYPSNIRSYLFLIMERTKRPLILRAGGVFPLSLSTLMSILRSSYSYMAVLQRLNRQ
ncbi:unnamed protein product [Callosobruchus maculatus]|uniref:Odorant receptor n=2 Tax=Callosobruchus maculatus TaxID=64391 RepID=A0A653CX41_CALMS|nr:unnamed protein product [Callosobruchus maculatus]